MDIEKIIFNACCQYDINTLINLTSTYDKFKITELIYLKNYIDILIYLIDHNIIENDALLLISIKYNNIDIIQYCLNKEIKDKEELELQIGRYADFNTYSWLSENMHINIDQCCKGASQVGRLDFILYFDSIFELNLQEILSEAAKYGNIKIIEHFYDNENVDVSYVLLDAVEAGRLDVIKWYAENNSDIEYVIDEILELASKCGHKHIIEFISQNFNITDYDTILHNAAYKVHNDIVMQYLNRIEDINLLAINCCYKDNVEIFKICYNMGINNEDDVIQLCIQYNSKKILEFLKIKD